MCGASYTRGTISCPTPGAPFRVLHQGHHFVSCTRGTISCPTSGVPLGVTRNKGDARTQGGAREQSGMCAAGTEGVRTE